jgi:hypothetical protein
MMTPPIKQSRRAAGSLGSDPGRANHLAPLLGLLSDELAEIGGRHRHGSAAQVGEPLLDLGIGETGIDLTVFGGLPIAFHLTGGEASDSRNFETLLDIGPDIDPRAALGDKGYDSKSNRDAARQRVRDCALAAR